MAPQIKLFYSLALKDSLNYDGIKDICTARTDYNYMSGIRYINVWGMLAKLLEHIK